MSRRLELHKQLEKHNIMVSRQEINFKSKRDVFTYLKDNQDSFQIIITTNGVYFKEVSGQNLSVEVMEIIVELMKLLKEEEKQNYGIGE